MKKDILKKQLEQLDSLDIDEKSTKIDTQKGSSDKDLELQKKLFEESINNEYRTLFAKEQEPAISSEKDTLPDSKLDLDEEARLFEANLERQMAELSMNQLTMDTNDSTKTKVKYKGVYKKPKFSLLSILLIFLILYFLAKNYTSYKYKDLSSENDLNMKNIVQMATDNYYKQYRKYPTSDGNIVNVELLEQLDYITIDVSSFTDAVFVLNESNVTIQK